MIGALKRCEELARRGHAAIDSDEYGAYYRSPKPARANRRYSVNHHGTGWTGRKLPKVYSPHDG